MLMVLWTKVTEEDPVVGPWQHGITALHSIKREGISWRVEWPSPVPSLDKLSFLSSEFYVQGLAISPLCILNDATAYTDDCICDNIPYGLESGEFWQFMLPFEQLFIQYLVTN